MIDGIGKSITDFKSIVMIVPFGSRVFARLRSITDSISFTSSESNGTTALLYGYFPSTFDASINKPWEHVKMVNVAATASFRMPEILATTAILLLWFSPPPLLLLLSESRRDRFRFSLSLSHLYLFWSSTRRGRRPLVFVTTFLISILIFSPQKKR